MALLKAVLGIDLLAMCADDIDTVQGHLNHFSSKYARLRHELEQLKQQCHHLDERAARAELSAKHQLNDCNWKAKGLKKPKEELQETQSCGFQWEDACIHENSAANNARDQVEQLSQQLTTAKAQVQSLEAELDSAWAKIKHLSLSGVDVNEEATDSRTMPPSVLEEQMAVQNMRLQSKLCFIEVISFN